MPVAVWPIEEFTYLQPSRWNGTRSADRMPYLERYWHAADPDYCDGGGAESFATLPRRAEATLTRLAALPEGAPAYVSATADLFRRYDRSSSTARSTTRPRCAGSGARARHRLSATPSALSSVWTGTIWTVEDPFQIVQRKGDRPTFLPQLAETN